MQAGADIVIAQGVEAGGHVRGSVSPLVLLPHVVRAVSLPVVASGEFASGESLVAALALGAQGIYCGTAYLATEESFAHANHKERVVGAAAEDTVYTDASAINWPAGSPVRVIATSLTESLGCRFLGHRPEAIPSEVIADEDGCPSLKFSTDSPLKTPAGALEPLALFAGQVAGAIEIITSVAERIAAIVGDARARHERLRRFGGTMS